MCVHLRVCVRVCVKNVLSVTCFFSWDFCFFKRTDQKIFARSWWSKAERRSSIGALDEGGPRQCTLCACMSTSNEILVYPCEIYLESFLTALPRSLDDKRSVNAPYFSAGVYTP